MIIVISTALLIVTMSLPYPIAYILVCFLFLLFCYYILFLFLGFWPALRPRRYLVLASVAVMSYDAPRRLGPEAVSSLTTDARGSL